MKFDKSQFMDTIIDELHDQFDVLIDEAENFADESADEIEQFLEKHGGSENLPRLLNNLRLQLQHRAAQRLISGREETQRAAVSMAITLVRGIRMAVL